MNTPPASVDGDSIPRVQSQSVLKRLLEEINGPESAALSTVATPSGSRRQSTAATASRSRSRSNSVWVAKASIAQGVRDKLRAADEARAGSKSITPSLDDVTPSNDPTPLPPRRHSTQAGFVDVSSQSGVWRPPTSLNESLFEYPTPPDSTVQSPPSDDSTEISPGRNVHTPPQSPDPVSKRPRFNREGSFGFRTVRASHTEMGAGMSPRDLAGSPSPIYFQRTVNTRPSVVSRNSVSSNGKSSGSSNLSLIIPPELNPSTRPVTPQQSTPDRGYFSPVQTPAWLRPLHLVDDEKDRSIYMSRHGDESKDHPLCLYCFRRYGAFHRIVRDGCELCGREDILESHYFENPEREY
ncbi:hypothetical protein BCR34DRAFT_596917 [Clohesyomyces aquaticus]|uniref:Uncharacterized protein n=1 Tax=Clohesyomyces aquaticus TaxID=1231657 RepID=A0A1Y2A4M0_9PLEO|nr:hypothetical protein BCR34DRAFT_596917 [Clohesyomyces aquaticus]